MVLSKSWDSPNILTGFIRVHWLRVPNISPLLSSGERELSSHLFIFQVLSAFFIWCSAWRWSSQCPSNAVSRCRVVAKDAASILRELTYTCTQHRRLCRAKSLQCLVWSTFLGSLLIFSPFFLFHCLSFSLKCFPCIMESVCMCLHVWLWEHACVCMCVSLRSQETLLVNTSGICSSVMLALVSVTHFCAIYMWCVQLQMTNICLHFELSFFFSLAGTELFVVVVVQSICLLSERMLYTL